MADAASVRSCASSALLTALRWRQRRYVGRNSTLTFLGEGIASQCVYNTRQSRRMELVLNLVRQTNRG